MALGTIASGTQTADGTEQTLNTDTTGQVYVLALDTGAMANGDELEVRIKTIVLSAGTERVAYYAVYKHSQTQPIKYSSPVPADVSCKVTIKQTAGTNRSYPWKVLHL